MQSKKSIPAYRYIIFAPKLHSKFPAYILIRGNGGHDIESVFFLASFFFTLKKKEQ